MGGDGPVDPTPRPTGLSAHAVVRSDMPRGTPATGRTRCTEGLPAQQSPRAEAMQGTVLARKLALSQPGSPDEGAVPGQRQDGHVGGSSFCCSPPPTMPLMPWQMLLRRPASRPGSAGSAPAVSRSPSWSPMTATQRCWTSQRRSTRPSKRGEGISDRLAEEGPRVGPAMAAWAWVSAIRRNAPQLRPRAPRPAFRHVGNDGHWGNSGPLLARRLLRRLERRQGGWAH